MFSKKTFEFLAQLDKNNNRDWFNDHKSQYEEYVREPALDFIRQMQAPLADVSSHFVASDKKVGGSLMRIHKDARFSKDKTPYKINVGIQFRHFMGKDVHAPGFYFHLANDECFVGAGIWRPESKALNAIRTCIDENPNSYKKAIYDEQFKSIFEMSGESLKRPPRGFEKEHPLIDELKRKDFIAISPLTQKQICSNNLVDTVLDRYKVADSLMGYLCFALEQPY